MSTNKTQNYNLHSWEPTDDFQLSEINANFAALDAGAIRMVVGRYNSAARVELGFRPKAVIAMIAEGNISGSTFFWAISYPDQTRAFLIIDDTGFTPASASGVSLTHGGRPFHYIAFY